MNKTFLFTAIVGVFAAAITPAFAGDGTISFTGKIEDVTCTVTGGSGTDAGAQDFTVTLPTVQTTVLAADGQRAGAKPFSVVIGGSGESGCTDGKIAKLWWETAQSPNIDSATGNLKNTAASGAGNVQVGLSNSGGTPINLWLNDNPSTATIASNTATLNYTAEYVATGGAATAGDVTSSVVYSVGYN